VCVCVCVCVFVCVCVSVCVCVCVCVCVHSLRCLFNVCTFECLPKIHVCMFRACFGLVSTFAGAKV
jgi:hypothetical protein